MSLSSGMSIVIGVGPTRRGCPLHLAVEILRERTSSEIRAARC